MITFPDTFASSTLAIATTVSTSFLPFIILVGGVLLAILAVGVLIRVLHHA